MTEEITKRLEAPAKFKKNLGQKKIREEIYKFLKLNDNVGTIHKKPLRHYE